MARHLETRKPMNVKGIFLAVTLQLAVLLGFVGWHSYTLLTGQPVSLTARIVDPWDPFRGAHVRLEYPFSLLSGEEVADQINRPGASVWLTLKKEGESWVTAGVSSDRPRLQGENVALRGKIVDFYTGPEISPPPPRRPSGDLDNQQSTPEAPKTDIGRQVEKVRVRYGIEQYYVAESDSQTLAAADEVTVKVLVDSFGRAVVREVTPK